MILEASEEIGGISRTIRYKGNRMDIGGHRFFSKCDRVMQWWMELMPPDLSAEGACGSDRRAAGRDQLPGQEAGGEVPAAVREEPPLRGLGPLQAMDEAERDADDGRPDDADGDEWWCLEPADPDLVMLIRPRRAGSTICGSSSTIRSR